jgi:hypothetical protein
MANVGIFMNLGTGHGEARRRMKWFTDNLPSRTLNYEYGAGDYQQYSDRAMRLVGRNPSAKVFVATCWPTLKQGLLNWTDKPIVVAGLVDAGFNYSDMVYGIKGFDSAVLCPYWPALIKAVSGGSVTKIAVIYDWQHPGTARQFEVIDQAVKAAGSMCSTLELTAIHAEDVTNQSSTNLDIGKDITNWLAGVGNDPAGLIVTASTRTTMLRDDILRVVKQRNQTPNKLFAIFPSSLFVKHANDGTIATPEGALMSYGPNLEKLYKKVATDYILPILRHSNPKDWPKPPLITNDTFEWFVSEKAAAEVGYTIPAQLNLTLCDGSSKTLTPIRTT